MNRIEKLKAFISANPQDHFSKHALAMEYVKLGNDSAARTLLESILTAEPEYTGSYFHLGKLLERQQEFEEAKQVYEKGIEMAHKQGERHTKSELMSALENME